MVRCNNNQKRIITKINKPTVKHADIILKGVKLFLNIRPVSVNEIKIVEMPAVHFMKDDHSVLRNSVKLLSMLFILLF